MTQAWNDDIYSRDVQFNDLECGVEKESSDPDKRRYVELELPSDDETLSDTPCSTTSTTQI